MLLELKLNLISCMESMPVIEKPVIKLIFLNCHHFFSMCVMKDYI